MRRTICVGPLGLISMSAIVFSFAQFSLNFFPFTISLHFSRSLRTPAFFWPLRNISNIVSGTDIHSLRSSRSFLVGNKTRDLQIQDETENFGRIGIPNQSETQKELSYIHHIRTSGFIVPAHFTISYYHVSRLSHPHYSHSPKQNDL